MRIPAALLALTLAQLGARAFPAEPGDAPPAHGVLTRAPELVAFIPAEYPAEAEATGIEGAVLLAIVIDEAGEVRQAAVLEPGPLPAFSAAALHAVAQFRFRPAEIDGVPATVEITYRYDFVLRRVAPAPATELPVVLSGRVVERGTRTPVAGAAVEAEGAVAETDAEGRFELRGIAPGDVIVRVVSAEHEPASFRETIEEGKRRELEYRLTRRHYDPYEAVVRGDRGRKEVSVHTLGLDEIRTMPGTQGDTLKVLQDLPGVARSPYGIGLLVVRGSAPTDTPVYLDGIEVPLLFHFGGVTSVVSSDVVEAIDFYPGNFGARFGRALGGTVEIRTREAKRELHGAAQLDLFDGRAEVEGPVTRGSGFLSIRRSWVDAVLAVALPRVAPDSASDLRVAPRYYDYQGKLSAPLLGGTASLLVYGSDDALELLRPQDRADRPTLGFSTVFHRAGATWRRPLGPRATNDLVVAIGRDDVDVVQGANLGVRTGITSLTLRDAVVWRLSPALSLEAGIDAIARAFRYSVYAPPARAPGTIGGYTGVQAMTAGETSSGTWIAPAAYVEADWRALPRLRVVAGLRVDGDSRLRTRPVWVDPRLSAFVDVAPGTQVTAAAGLFGAAPQPQELTRTFGNPELAPQRAVHLALGLRQKLPWSSALELTAFHKELRSLVVPTRDLDASGTLLRLSNGGAGRVTGVELLVRRELARGLFGWLAYTWSEALRRDDPSLPSYPQWHPFVFDQTHVLALVLSYRLPGEWMLGTRVRAVSGNPYTGPAGHVLDADSGRFQCIPTPRPYAQRLPGFFQADARVDKRWVFERWMFAMYLDVQNVTNRENAETRMQSYDCTQSVPVPSIPVFPAFGLRAEW